MKKNYNDEFNEVLSLWKDPDITSLHFAEIVEKLKQKNILQPKKWYTKKVQRILNKMVEQRLLTKDKMGAALSSPSCYKPTEEAPEFNIHRYFENIRKTSTQKKLVFQQNESLIVYGIPKEKELTSTEQHILKHILDRIESSFESLYLLKQSIRRRKTIGEDVLDADLIETYVREEICDYFGKKLTIKANLKGSEESRKREIHGLGEMLLEVAKEVNVYSDEKLCSIYPYLVNDDKREVAYLENVINIEKKPCFISPTYAPIGMDGDLAIIKTLPEHYLEEHMLDPYKQLNVLIEMFQPNYEPYPQSEKTVSELPAELVEFFKDPCDKCDEHIDIKKNDRFDDADLFHIADQFVKHMTFEHTLTLEQIKKLAEWKKLPLKLYGGDNHEKLVRCIYHFFEEHQNRVKELKESDEAYEKLSPEEKQKLHETMKPVDVTIYTEVAEKPQIPEERITPEILAAVKTKLPEEIEQIFAKKRCS
ncbi:MAG: hypothetical protein FWD52_08025 [Candidatus Bathyarchaeota archaeon]|nr:hypothetical protein [Candidatus Termiticorpusculum sp.]